MLPVNPFIRIFIISEVRLSPDMHSALHQDLPYRLGAALQVCFGMVYNRGIVGVHKQKVENPHILVFLHRLRLPRRRQDPVQPSAATQVSLYISRAFAASGNRQALVNNMSVSCKQNNLFRIIWNLRKR